MWRLTGLVRSDGGGEERSMNRLGMAEEREVWGWGGGAGAADGFGGRSRLVAAVDVWLPQKEQG